MVGLYTALSRMFGFLRDAVLAYYFGARDLMDIFVVAFRIPNSFRRLFAEGSLTISFVPVFTQTLRQDSREEARKLFDTIFTLGVIMLLGVSLLGIWGAPILVRLFAEGFLNIPEKFQGAVLSSRITFSYIMFISLVAAASGVLNSLRHFTAPAASTLLLNLSIIAGASLLPIFSPWSRLTCACLGVSVGGLFQLLFQFPFLRIHEMLPRPRLDLRNPRVRRVLKLAAPSIFGAGVYQISLLFMTRFASLIPGGGANSFLYYADRVVELPLGIFGISVASSALPAFSRLAADRDHDGFASTFSFALRSILFIVLPATAGLIALRVGITQVLFESGNFTWLDTVETSGALFYFACGLTALAAVRITVAGFNAHQDTVTPVMMSAFTLCCSILLCMALIGPMGHRGLALAVATSNFLNFLGLTYFLRKKLGPLGGREIGGAFLRLGGVSLILGLLMHFGASQILWEEGGRTLLKGIYLFGLIFGGVGFYLAAAYLLRFPEFQEFFRRKFKD